VAEFDAAVEKEPGRFLWVDRLVPYKHPELVAEAFRGLPYRLTMVGVGPLEEKLANLWNVGYQGYYSVEHHSGKDEYVEVAIQLARVREVLEQFRDGQSTLV